MEKILWNGFKAVGSYAGDRAESSIIKNILFNLYTRRGTVEGVESVDGLMSYLFYWRENILVSLEHFYT